MSTASNQPRAHTPVLLQEVITALEMRAGGVYVDGTFGRGGYTLRMLESARCTVIACDCDPAAAAVAQAFAAPQGQFQFIATNFSDLSQHVPPASAAGVVFDLGVSSPQLDEAMRGFSFRHDGPLDMRMNNQAGETAADLVNTLPETQLADLIFTLGEEKQSRQVAKAIVIARLKTPIQRTLQLADIVRRVVRPARDGLDPATRTFQALRLAVNNELAALQQGLVAAEKILSPQGKLVVVSFHSLEDRIVKQFLVSRSRPPRPSRYTPVNDNAPAPTFLVSGKQPITPSKAEAMANPRAASARLRFATRTAAPAIDLPLEAA